MFSVGSIAFPLGIGTGINPVPASRTLLCAHAAAVLYDLNENYVAFSHNASSFQYVFELLFAQDDEICVGHFFHY